MEYRRHILASLAYLEEHLTDELSPAGLARAAGYSPYHFSRIFKIVTGLSPADYVRKRRVSEAAKFLREGRGSVSEAAFAFGFQSHENFTRAFFREHGVTPSAFAASTASLRLFHPYEEPDEQARPEVWTEVLPGFSLTGMVFHTAHGQNKTDIPRFWNQYNTRSLSRRMTRGVETDDYGLCLIDEESFDYFIGVPSELFKEEPAGYSCRSLFIPSGAYAVFLTPPTDGFGFVKAIHRTWDEIYRDYLPSGPYRERKGFSFECYRESSLAYREKIYIPIED